MENPMSINDPRVDFFHNGRRQVLTSIRQSIADGDWSQEKRANWLKIAVHLRQIHRCQAQQRAYYAGIISGLKSRLSAQFSEGGTLPLREYETGWDWDGDEDSFGVA
jgi:hypothetical protein